MQTRFPRLAQGIGALLPFAFAFSALAQPDSPRPVNGSKKQAVEAIREFEKNPGLRLPEANPTFEGRDWYFDVPAGPKYWVSKRTGRVWHVIYSLVLVPARPVAEPAARAIARRYAADRFGAFMKRSTRELVARPISDRSLMVVFREVLPANGALSGNALRVRVDLARGRVQEAELRDSEIPARARALPKISSAAAAGAARRAAPQAISATTPELTWTAEAGGRLIWTLELQAPKGPRCVQILNARIDALSGALVALDRLDKPTRPLAGEGECLLVMAAAQGPYPGSGAVLVLLKPQVHGGALWVPAQFRRLFASTGGARPPTKNLDGVDHVAAQALLKSATEVASSGVDIRRRAITVYLDTPKPLFRARQLGLSRSAIAPYPDRERR